MSTSLSVRDISTEPASWGDSLPLQRAEGISVHPLETSSKVMQYAVNLPNGKFVRMSQKLYDVLVEIDGRATVSEIAANLSSKWAIEVTPSDVEAVVHNYLKPHGLIADEDYDDRQQSAVARKGNPWLRKLLLQDFFFHFKMIPSEIVTPIARLLSPLHNKLLAVIVVLSLLAVNWSAYGKLTALIQAGELKLTAPFEFLCTFLIIFSSIVFHEFGHASAVARYGGTPDHIGFGLYFIYPALYANVNQSWRFSRKQRMVIDMGGIYFQIMASIVCYIAYLQTDRMIFLVSFTILQALWIYSFIPFFKYDGYWLVSDALGVPNLRKRAFLMLVYKVRQLTGRKSDTRLDLELSAATTFWVILYSISSLAFSVFLTMTLIRFAPSRFYQYPGYLSATLQNLSKAAGGGAYSEAAVILILLTLRTLILIGLVMIIVSLAISMYQAVKAYRGRKTYDAGR